MLQRLHLPSMFSTSKLASLAGPVPKVDDAPSDETRSQGEGASKTPIGDGRHSPQALTATDFHSKRRRVRTLTKSERVRLLSGPTIDVYVGETKRHWSVHRNLLCHHSDFLSSELLPNETGKKPRNELNLPDDDPDGFELLVKWLYQGSIEDVSEFADPLRKYDYAASCQKLYLLCDRFEITELKNIAMDQYRKGLSQARLVPDWDEINEIYGKSHPGDPFRKLMIKIAARQIMDPDTERVVDQYRGCFSDNPDFAVELVNEIRSSSGGMLFKDPTEGDPCAYHDHDDGSNCYGHGKHKGRQVWKDVLKAERKSLSQPPNHSSQVMRQSPISRTPPAATPPPPPGTILLLDPILTPTPSSPGQKRNPQTPTSPPLPPAPLLSPPQTPPAITNRKIDKNRQHRPRRISASEILLLRPRASTVSSEVSTSSVTAHRSSSISSSVAFLDGATAVLSEAENEENQHPDSDLESDTPTTSLMTPTTPATTQATSTTAATPVSEPKTLTYIQRLGRTAREGERSGEPSNQHQQQEQQEQRKQQEQQQPSPPLRDAGDILRNWSEEATGRAARDLRLHEAEAVAKQQVSRRGFLRGWIWGRIGVVGVPVLFDGGSGGAKGNCNGKGRVGGGVVKTS